MKIQRLETHDRWQEFHNKMLSVIVEGLTDCIKKNELSLKLQEKSSYIYIFAHPRTADDGVTKRMLWQPRLTRPEPQTNSYLFRIQSHTDLAEICWLLPPEEMWGQYKKGNITESDHVNWSIYQYRFNRTALAAPFKDDLPEETAKNIYVSVISEIKAEKTIKDMYFRQDPAVEFLRV